MLSLAAEEISLAACIIPSFRGGAGNFSLVGHNWEYV